MNCHQFGLGSFDKEFFVIESADATRLGVELHGEGEKAKIQNVRSFFENFDVPFIDLMKINIEGGEYDLLPALVETGEIRRIGYLQIQFHNFTKSARVERDRIREALKETHDEVRCFPFVWEFWKIKLEP